MRKIKTRSELDRLIGKKNNRLTIVRYVERNKNREHIYECKCECGKTCIAVGSKVISGAKQSCGCLLKEYQTPKLKNGEKIGYLTVICAINKTDRGRNRIYKCKCNCGNIIELSRLHYRESCGCKWKYNDSKEAARNTLLRRYKAKAKKRKIKFGLSEKKFKELTTSNCHYCGTRPEQISKEGRSYCVYNGIDRRDQDKGYVDKNCVSCCKTCNFAKHVMNENVFYDWLEKVYNHTKKRRDDTTIR